MSVVEVNADMDDGPLKHSQDPTLKRILRRRGRRRKVGANDGSEIKSWGEYSKVTFTPSGDRSALGCGVVVMACVGVFLIFGLGSLLIAGMDVIATHPEGWLQGMWEVVRSVLYSLIILSVLGAPLTLGMWVYVKLDGDNANSRERLIAEADRLRAKRRDEQL